MTALQRINFGAAPTGIGGDSARSAFVKFNANMDALDAQAVLTSAPMVTESMQLTAAAHKGRRVKINLDTAGPVWLPPASDFGADESFLLRNVGRSVVTLAAAPESGDTLSLVTLNPGESALFDSDGVHLWTVLLGGFGSGKSPGDGYAPIDSPIFGGVPEVPTAAAGTATDQAASTAFVEARAVAAIAAAVAQVLGGAPGALDTLKELADALGDDANYAASVTSALAGKATPADVAAAIVAALASYSNTAAMNAAIAAALAAIPGAVIYSGLPAMDGNASAGTSNGFARGDHVHPTDSTLAAAYQAGDAATLTAANGHADAAVAAGIAGLVNGAPAALDTLKELADALGDDANAVANLTNAIAQKADQAAMAAGDAATLASAKTYADSAVASASPKPVNNTGASSDVALAIGQIAYIDVVAASSVALHVATGDNQCYDIELHLSGSPTIAGAAYPLLLPNNSTYTNYFMTEGGGWGAGSGTVINLFQSGFALGFTSIVHGISKVSTKTASKAVVTTASGFSTVNLWTSIMSSVWVATASSQADDPDTTTPWTSLGTVTFPYAVTGRIIARRTA